MYFELRHNVLVKSYKANLLAVFLNSGTILNHSLTDVCQHMYRNKNVWKLKVVVDLLIYQCKIILTDLLKVFDWGFKTIVIQIFIKFMSLKIPEDYKSYYLYMTVGII